ncbi:MAG: DUF6263 family protein [Candidatus Zixiibacteriota bacterium]
MIRKTVIITCLLLAVLLFSCEQGTKKVSLKFKHQPGLALKYKLSQKHHMQVLEGDSVTKENSSETEIIIEHNVKRIVDDTTAEIYEILRLVKEVVTTKDTTITWDEQKEWGRILYTAPNGKIIDIEFSDETSDYSKEYIKDLYEQGMPVFPSGEFATGDTWTQTTKVHLENDQYDASMKYTVKSFAREKGYDCVLIDYDGNLIIPIMPYEMDGAVREGVNRVKMNGVMYFAYKEGVIVSIREHWDMEGDRTVNYKEKGKIQKYSVIMTGDDTQVLTDRKMQ